MSKKLHDICFYGKEKVETSNIDLNNYVSTENMLPNKSGIVPSEKLPNLALTPAFFKGDILVSNIRPYFKKIWYASSNGGCSNDVLVFRAKENIDSSYLYYLLADDNFFTYAMASAKGTKMPRGDKSAIMEYVIPEHGILIQQKIAKILSSIDRKIYFNNKINNNLEQQAQAIFKSWFVDFEPFGGTMPKFAELVPIEKICKIVTKGTTPTTLGFSFVEQGINFIKAESILDNHSFDYNKFAYIDEVTYKKLSRSILEPKDIVFTIAGTLGRFAIIDEEVIPANTNQAVAIIRADIGKIEPEYLYTFFLGNWHNNYYSKRIQQAVQANLNLTTIKSLPIILLSQEYRIKYLNIIKPILWQIKYNEKENRILTQLRDTLLPKLMSGEIDVSKVEIDNILENQSTDKLSFNDGDI